MTKEQKAYCRRHCQETITKLRSNVSSLSIENRNLKENNTQLTDKNNELDSQLSVIQDWNTRLLDYLQISQEDFVKLMKDTAKSAELKDGISNFAKLIVREFRY